MQNLSFNYGFIDKKRAVCYNNTVITTYWLLRRQEAMKMVKGEKMFDRLIASIVTAEFFRKGMPGRERTPKRRSQETIPDITVLAAICREGISVE